MLDRQIFLIGLPGSGRHTLGRRAALELGLPFTDLEEWMTLATGRSVSEIRDQVGEDGLRKAEAAALAWLTRGRPGLIVVRPETPLIPENLGIMRCWGSLILIDRPLENILADFDAETHPDLGENPEERLREMDENWMPVYRKAADVRMPDREDEGWAYALLLRVLRERYHA